jgi:hypothetical protein
MELTRQGQPEYVNAARIDLAQMTDAIWTEMKGQTDKRVIRETLEQILPYYENARIWGFVPILVRRDAIEMLNGRMLSAPAMFPLSAV